MIKIKFLYYWVLSIWHLLNSEIRDFLTVNKFSCSKNKITPLTLKSLFWVL